MTGEMPAFGAANDGVEALAFPFEDGERSPFWVDAYESVIWAPSALAVAEEKGVFHFYVGARGWQLWLDDQRRFRHLCFPLLGRGG